MIATASPECTINGESEIVKGALLLIYDVLISKEVARKKNEYVQSHTHRDGIDCLNYFLDLINQCAGYTDKYYNEHHKRVKNHELVEIYKKEREIHERNQFKESALLGDIYPHCLMVIEGIQTLIKMKSAGSLPLDYFDTLILRLNVSTKKISLIMILASRAFLDWP